MLVAGDHLVEYLPRSILKLVRQSLIYLFYRKNLDDYNLHSAYNINRHKTLKEYRASEHKLVS